MELRNVNKLYNMIH